MKIRTPYIVLFLLFVVLGVYYPSISAPLNTVDDCGMINAILNCGQFSLKDIFLPGGGGYYYRPLLSLTFIADNYFWGLQASFMHLENIILHAVNVLLVFFIAREIFRQHEVPNELLSLAAALLFALHPINTEPVNWISGRTDLLAGTFILLSLFLLLRALAKSSFVLCILASLSFLFSCFAKDNAVFFFPAALLIIWHYDGRGATLGGSLLVSLKKRFVFHFSFSSIVAVYFIIRHIAFAKADTGIATAMAGVVGQNSHILYTLKVIVKLLGFYAKKLFIPWPLNFAIASASDYYIIPGVALLIVIAYLLWRRDIIADLFLMSICIIAPAFLVALNRMAWTYMAERYLYVPAATFSIGITLVIYSLSKRFGMEKALPVFAVVLLSTTAYATVSRNIVWQDNLTLFQDTYQKSPGYPPVKNELALALKAHGRNAEGDRLITENSIGKGVRNSELCDLNRAALLYAAHDYKGTRRMLLDNLNPAGSLYPKMLLQLIAVDRTLLEETPDRKEKESIRQEIITLLTKLQENTGDPYFLYKLGQQYLSEGNKLEARKYFVKAFDLAPEDAFYKLPAKKLAEKLKQ